MNDALDPSLLDPQALLEEQQKQIEVSDDTLIGAIEAQEGIALGGESDPISTVRAQAIDYYLGAPFGNEIEGNSQVVSKDLFDTVEWIKPALLRIFAAGEKVCDFAPQNENDVKAAEQESDYVDYIIQRKNPWFMLALEWFTDALLTRNAYALAYWENKVEPTLERYQGLTDDQLAMIGMAQDAEIISHRAYQAPMPIPPEVQLMLMSQGVYEQFGPPPPITLHDVEVRRSQSYGCVKISILPPERCLVSQDTKGMSVRGGNFFEYWEYKTISSLRTEGFEVDDDISDSRGIDRGVIDQARDSAANTILGEHGDSIDPAMRKVKVRMCWIRNDYDLDGIAELRYVVLVGTNLLVNQEVSCIPVSSIVPYPMPHRHIGLSLHDVVSDLQLIKSALLRQVIDNAFLANNGRYGVDKNTVNLDDMMISRPGGAVRVDGPPGNSIMPFVHPQTAAQGISVIEYIDKIRQDRGGVSQPYAGGDVQSIMAQPGTVAQLTSAASQKIELIARILGEGVKELFQIVHELTLTNATMQDKVELRGEWVTVDPRQWRKRHDMNLSVGMGIVSRPQQAGALAQLISLQEKALPQGLTTYQKIFTALSKYAEALGFSTGKQFFTEPPPEAKYQPQPPYQVMVAEINARANVMVQDMKNHTELFLTQMKEEAQATRTYFETMIDSQNQAQDRFIRTVSEATDRMQELRLEGARADGVKQGSKESSAPNIVVHPPSVSVHIAKDGKKTIKKTKDGFEVTD